MENAPIKMVTSREFVHNVSAAKRSAIGGEHVIITDRGEPALALIPIADYRRMTKTDTTLVELLRLPDSDDFDLDFETVRIEAKDIDA